MTMLITEPKPKYSIILKQEYAITAYAVDGTFDESISKGQIVPRSRLTITFDKQEAKQLGEYRLATGAELNWWGCICEDIPYDVLISCEDGMYFYLETWTYDEEFGHDNFSTGFIKLK
ncbi:hypothetical protein [Paenibacillus paridis]|uniref:hypothetical protein n=1 Tax=Paenibacillus paridis TaxID=2583376 RepID=UPI00111DD21D|nr:hypothetical protein [Paenibacillus paridis]